MELYHLKTFVAVAEEGHLTRAAERLFASQPTVSSHIKALEAEMDVRLFIRTPKGMRLTEAGSRLLDKSRAILRAADDLIREAQSLSSELVGEVRLGLNSDPEYLRIVPLLTSMTEAHPKLRLQLSVGSTGSIQEDIRSGKLDGGFIFGSPRHPDVCSIPLHMCEFRVACTSQWSGDFMSASLEEIAEMPWISTAQDCPCQGLQDSMFAQHGLRVARTMQVDGDEVIKALVAAGKGIALLREDECRAAESTGVPLVCRRFDGLEEQLGFAYSRPREQDPVMKAVLDGVRKVWRDK